ncbi:unnamed protein product [Meganyctiphanes norvegica]|uniref:Uncharacterized protein n=1 Tax=Meganyctiphanes norvegica TaxID=48144 RepID=A0AAV2RNL3_MEGNR
MMERGGRGGGGEVLAPSYLYDLLGPLHATDDLLFEGEMETEDKDSLIARLTQEVVAKAEDLDCAQVMVPPKLIHDVTAQTLRLSDSEPCGLRGCVLHLQYQDGSTFQHLTQVIMDPHMPNTFEIYLTLQPDNTSWYNKMTRLIKPLRKSGQLLLSTNFTLEKRKLYPS